MKIKNITIYSLALILIVALVRESTADIKNDTAKEDLQEVVAEDGEAVEELDPSSVENVKDLELLLFENEDDIMEEGEECSRISPKEIFHIEIHPRLLNLLDEMSHFVESVLNKIEEALIILLPHVQDSPIGGIKVEELFPEVRRFMFGTMRDVYDLVRAAWRDLIRSHVIANDDAVRQLEALKVVRDVQIQGEERMRASLMELSVTLKAIVLNSIHVVQDSLKLPKDIDESEAAVKIAKKLPRVAPNFLGTLMMKIMEKGADPEAYKKILTNTLRELTGPVEQMYQELEAVVEAEGDTEVLVQYWKKMIDDCHSRLLDDPLYASDFEIIFRNEEYLTSLVLGLMASF